MLGWVPAWPTMQDQLSHLLAKSMFALVPVHHLTHFRSTPGPVVFALVIHAHICVYVTDEEAEDLVEKSWKLKSIPRSSIPSSNSGLCCLKRAGPTVDTEM